MPSDFEQLCDETLASAGDVTAVERDQIIADLKLRYEHAGEYAAYVDEFPVVGRTRQFVRTLIAVSPDLRIIQKALEQRSEEEQKVVTVDYVDPLSGDLVTPHNLSQR